MVQVDAGEIADNQHFVLVGPGRVEVVAEMLPALGRHWVRVRFAFCGLCGTDMSHVEGRRPAVYPLSLGHEWVAVVEAVGSGIRYFAPGDVVTTDLNFRCGMCRECLAGRSHLCLVGQVERFTNRGFGERADIHASYLQKCAGPPSPRLALAEPLSCVRHAYLRATVRSDDRVLVIGAGGIGLCMAFLLAQSGMQSFDVIDVSRPRLERLAPLLGGPGRVSEEPMGDYDVVFDVSGSASGLRLGCAHLLTGGRLCTMSHLAPQSGDFLLELLLHKDATVMISYLNGDAGNLDWAVRLLEQRWDDRWDATLEVVPLTDLQHAIRDRTRSSFNKTILDLG